MAWLELDASGTYHVSFRMGERRFKRSLKTDDHEQAQQLASRIEENMALVEMIVGENSRAISTLTRLLQTPYGGWLYSPAPNTPAPGSWSAFSCAAIALPRPPPPCC